MLQLKRVYEPAASTDGQRILVDRLWPRGLSKARAAVNEWCKDIAPSTELRKWFAHDSDKWPEFQRRYKHELRSQRGTLNDIARRAMQRRVTLVYGARDETHNDAVVLAAVIRARMKGLAAARKRERRK